MLRINNIRVYLDDVRELKEIAAHELKIKPNQVKACQVFHKAIDARRKNKLSFVYSFLLEVENEQKFLGSNKNISLFQAEKEPEIIYGQEKLLGEVIVVGAGPAGLICALLLAQHGYKPLLVERGLALQERKNAVDRFWQNGTFSAEGNVQFGAGGAGTFSDGKLTTRVNDPAGKKILQFLIQAGAPAEIEYEHKPHVGTDILHKVVRNLTEKIESLGGRIVYQDKLEKISLAPREDKIEEVFLSKSGKTACGALALAIGHSARDTYEMLLAAGILLEAKPFSVGVRIEHPQALIDRAQYGEFAGHPKLGPADYALVYHAKDKQKSVYSFCMCPGGLVVAASSEEKQVVVNGMSYYQRNSGLANSALVVGVTPEDFGLHPLAGVKFQQSLESLAFIQAGSNYCAPAQSVASFLQGKTPTLKGTVGSSYRPGITGVNLENILPAFVTATLAAGLKDFERKLKGFASGPAVLVGVETRTSAPVRIVREKETREAKGLSNLYPAGEGAGYAGGIMSAALDGYHTALAIMKKYKQPLR